MSQSKVLADRIYPADGLAAEVVRIAAANILLVLCAHIAFPLPWTPVPITGQTFGVLLVAILLGSRRGALTLGLYLLEGLAGLPVFQPLGLPGPAPRCSVENDLADHGSVEIDYEKAGAPLGRPGHLALKLVTRPGATEVGAHLWRGQQLDVCCTVPGLGLTEHEPLGPDRLRRPRDGSQVCHARRLVATKRTRRDSGPDNR